MSLQTRLSRMCAFALLAAPVLAIAQTPLGQTPVIERQTVSPDVTVRPLPVTSASRPFLAAREDLASHGYVEEEFILSGRARAYEWVDGSLKIRAVTPLGPYATRVLVRRPIDPKRFSGDIEVETLNASTALDITTTMATSGGYIMRRGDVWVGITSKPLTMAALKRFDPLRYADLQWSNPGLPAAQCERPSLIPDYSLGDPELLKKYPPTSSSASEDGLIWDIYAQLGALLKSDARTAILPGFRKPRLYATGYSQSGLLQRTFISGFHNVMRLPDGGPVFDGYLVEVGPAMLRINQCSKDVLPDDPRNRLPIVNAPVINILSEGEMTWLGLHTRQPDVIQAHTGLVTYEVAGAAHGHGMGLSGRSTPEEAARAGFKTPMLPPPGGIVLNDLPRGYISTAALHNLQAWAEEGRAPPQAQPLATTGSTIARDANGNALGGVRTPWVDVPTASYQGALGLGALSIVGSKTPFPPAKLNTLYPSRADYVAKVKADVDGLVKGRWLLPEDGDRIVKDAETSPAF